MAASDREDVADEACERLSHPHHEDRIKDRVGQPHDEVDLMYSHEVSDHYAGDVHEGCDDVLEGFVVSVQC